MSLFRKKSLTALLSQAEEGEKGLKRTLGAGNLIALGIGAIIGAGLFVRTAAAAGQAAGPGVTLSFVVAAIGCAFAESLLCRVCINDSSSRKCLRILLRYHGRYWLHGLLVGH